MTGSHSDIRSNRPGRRIPPPRRNRLAHAAAARAAVVPGLRSRVAHLLIMLGTRWGDRRVTSKALFFSVAVHISLAFGIIAMVPSTASGSSSDLTSEKKI